MTIEEENNRFVLTEVYTGITLRTKAGKELHICMRDSGFDIRLNYGKLHHLDSELDWDFPNELVERPRQHWVDIAYISDAYCTPERSVQDRYKSPIDQDQV